MNELLPSEKLAMGVSRSRKIRLSQGIIIGFIIGFIELAPRVDLIGPTTLVPLSDMFVEIVRLTASGELTPHFAQTAAAVFGAFGLSILTGLPAGIVLWRSQTLHEILKPYLLIYYAVPFFAFYPLLITLFGIGIVPILLIAFGFSVVIVITNTASGFNEVPDAYVKAGQDMNLTTRQLFQYVYLPAAAPYVFTGLKLGFIYALIGTIASEFILAENGLGWLIAYNYNSFNVDQMFAAMLLVIMLAVAVNTLLARVERHLRRRVQA